MDSKLKGLTIASAIGIIILILLVVVYINRDQVAKKGTGKSDASFVASKEYADGLAKEAAESELTAGAKETFEGYWIGTDLHSFMQDEEFFDKEESKYEAYMRLHNTLSLMMTSVEKDLRIKVLDYDGNIVSGQPFVVTLDGVGEYKDTDKDGIIYIPYLKSGDYSVKLGEIEGYTVSDEAVTANVKEQVEYIEIADISALIKTEKDIDPSIDDSNYEDMAEDADASEIKRLLNTQENATLGIDVSKYQGEIDWKQVADAGIKFAILRCGYRGYSTGSLVIDPTFEKNLSEAVAAGVDVGVYFFTQATNEVEAVEEASMILSLIHREYVTYPIFIDTEASGAKKTASGAPGGRADGLGVEDRTAVCKAFCETIKSGGYTPGVYASKNWLNNRIDAEELDDYIIWLAEYRDTPTYDGIYNMWQYTSKGNVPGISGNVDLDLSYLEVKEKEKWEN